MITRKEILATVANLQCKCPVLRGGVDKAELLAAFPANQAGHIERCLDYMVKVDESLWVMTKFTSVAAGSPTTLTYRTR